MAKTITIAARVDADLDGELERLAAATGRSKSWLIIDALRSYVANEQQFLAAVEEGKQALRDGKTIDHKTVVAAFERIVGPRP
ncbi:MAG TPA: ribbon-helix-helix domain-containing protein [Methylocella sp.]|nr:ribbon-helix-helix domain-containing protein [Methylocella sp.]